MRILSFLKRLLLLLLPPVQDPVDEEHADGIEERRHVSLFRHEHWVFVRGHNYIVRGEEDKPQERCKAFIQYVNDDRLDFTWHDCAAVLKTIRNESNLLESHDETATQNLDATTRPIGRSDFGGGVG